MQNVPKQIARKRFIAFSCSDRFMKEHRPTKSRQNSDMSTDYESYY